MGLYELIMKRRSVRNFESQEIPEDVIEKLVDAANNAPSGGNIQPLSIILVREPERRAELADIVGGQPWVKNAPLSMIFCIDFYRLKKWAATFDTQFKGEKALSHFLIAYADIMCSAQNVVLLAGELGLGSVYIGTIQSSMDRGREYFEIPKYVVPMMVLSLGYPRSVPKNVPKLERAAVVHREKYRVDTDAEIAQTFEKKYGSLEDTRENYFERTFVEVVEADKQQRESWADSVKEEMKKLEIKSNAEFLFKLRYPTDQMVKMNDGLFRSLKNAGFDFS
ncbi:MAG: nitroreductase family protein [Candidatus Eiseniibacteriota bacterium]|nr:MAG: nitroreductase family protein [Candidatus Eisenbacteria bacterium]